jgi:hypothetical protein
MSGVAAYHVSVCALFSVRHKSLHSVNLQNARCNNKKKQILCISYSFRALIFLGQSAAHSKVIKHIINVPVTISSQNLRTLKEQFLKRISYNIKCMEYIHKPAGCILAFGKAYLNL